MFSLTYEAAKQYAKEKFGTSEQEMDSTISTFRENRVFFESILSVAKTLHSHHQALSEAHQKMSALLINHASALPGPLTENLVSLATLQSSIESSHAKFTEAIQQTLIEPYTRALNNDVKKVRELKDQYKQSRRQNSAVSNIQKSKRHSVSAKHVEVVGRYEAIKSQFSKEARSINVTLKQSLLAKLVGYMKSEHEFTKRSLSTFNQFDWSQHEANMVADEVGSFFHSAKERPTSPMVLPKKRSTSAPRNALALEKSIESPRRNATLSTSKIPVSLQPGSLSQSPVLNLQSSYETIEEVKDQEESPVDPLPNEISPKEVGRKISKVPSLFELNKHILGPFADFFQVQYKVSTPRQTDKDCLPKHQMQIAAFEAYMLLADYPLHEPENWDDKDDFWRKMRLDFQISKKTARQIAETLYLPDTVYRSKLPKTSLLYRRYLLKSTQSSQFENQEEYEAWIERQVRLCEFGAIGFIQDSGVTLWTIGSEQMKANGLIESIKQAADAVVEAKGLSLQQVSNLLKAFEDLICKSFEFIRKTYPEKMNSSEEVAYSPGLKLQIYSTLLEVLFDWELHSLHANSSQYIIRLKEIRKHADISGALHSVCFLKSFINVSMRHCHDAMTWTSVQAEICELISSAERLTETVLQTCLNELWPMVVYLEESLSDMFRNYPDDNMTLHYHTRCLLKLQELYEKYDPAHNKPKDSIAGLIVKSLCSHYASIREDSLLLKGFSWASNLASHLMGEIKKAVENIAVMLEFKYSKTKDVFVVGFAVLYFQDIMDTLKDTIIEKSIIGFVAIVEEFISFMKDYGIEEFFGVNVKEFYESKVSQWMDYQKVDFANYLSRIIDKETWEPIGSMGKTASLVDLCTLFSHSIDAFGLYALYSSAPMVEVSKVIRHTVRDYATVVLPQLVGRRHLVPPTKTLFTSSGLINRKAAQTVQSGIPPLDEEVVERLNSRNPQLLCTRLNDVYSLLSEIGHLESSIKDKIYLRAFDDLQTAIEEVDKEFVRINDLLKSAVATFTRDLATRIIFFDLREQFLDNLYAPTVMSTRVSQVLESLNEIFGVIQKWVVIDELKNEMSTHIFYEFMHCYEQILLQAGPNRMYEIKEVALIREDVDVRSVCHDVAFTCCLHS
eukprot:TRINITY_DN5315_c0_g1_i1.p1 TRINITY_DN5315_c0_g1~~TRINITY_DN5315_c0_g1_i1.p1  ORF type:complete len:1126 (+),score=193.02 TRINITY_DN5315_c0_g1_i1:108-3485(+)